MTAIDPKRTCERALMTGRNSLFWLWLSMAGVGVLFGCSIEPGSSVAQAGNERCRAIREEIDSALAQTQSRLSPTELVTIGIFPPAAFSSVEASNQRRVSAEERLAYALEAGQRNHCDVVIQGYGDGLSDRLEIAGQVMQCVKPNGVTVYARYSHWTAGGFTYIGSTPPKGPYIQLKEEAKDLPPAVQLFLFEKACQAHLQRPISGVIFGSGSTQSFHVEECAAVQALVSKKLLDESGLEAIVAYGVQYELYDRWKPRKDVAVRQCYEAARR